MKSLYSIAIALPLAAAMMFAQSQATPSQSSTQERKTESSVKTESSTQVEKSSSSQADRVSGQADAAGARTYTGTIVNANCTPASGLTSIDTRSERESSSSTAAGAEHSSSTSSKSTTTKTKSSADAKKDVLRHCQADHNTTSFAVLTGDGTFLKLDEAGNIQVKGIAAGKSLKNMKVTVTGSAEGDTLKVQSLSKM